MNCRYCRKPILIALSGLRHFCSEECKKAHRKAYMADLMKAKRSVSNRGGYIDINSSNVSSTEAHEKPICEGQKQGHGLSEDNFQGNNGKFIIPRVQTNADLRGCFYHPGIVCWHMVVYGNRKREEIGSPYERSRR